MYLFFHRADQAGSSKPNSEIRSVRIRAPHNELTVTWALACLTVKPTMTNGHYCMHEYWLYTMRLGRR